ncbi:DMT family transporter [Mariniblastus fucicola]|uniref:EamA-like transporter family protein n=1 Tax=Mariniblastus fucicola TaxID=980251 RepID=A0A5B9PAD2_9BACT|nr:DMT family transporter [Mariniblastus fucicola]QEG22449.1 EamA-like transporter family protein [Mariniblastus fucicola]
MSSGNRSTEKSASDTAKPTLNGLSDSALAVVAAQSDTTAATSGETKRAFSMRQVAMASGIVFTGAVLFSTKAILVKLAMPYGIEPVPLLLLRMVFAMPFYAAVLVWLSVKERDQHIPGREPTPWIRISVLGVVGYYLASFFDFYGLKFISASLERVILYSYPTIVLLISAVFARKRITVHQAIAVVICYVGIFVAIRFGGSGGVATNVPLGVFLVFLSAVTYAIYLVGSGELIPKMGVWRFTSIAMLVSTACVVVHFALTETVTDLWSYPPEVYWLGFAMAIFATVVPSFLISEGIKRIGATNAAVIGGVGPVSTIVLASIFLGESFTTAQLLGTLCVIVGVIYISINMKRD